jgi:putative chitinase
MVTAEQLQLVMTFAKSRIPNFLDPINQTMDEFGIDTPQEQAMFIAQIAHESGELRYVKELASGILYENRKDLGNVHPGDGVKYKGRGLIQVTGYDNYMHCGTAFGIDAINHPELLELPLYAARTAGWYWKSRDLDKYAAPNDDAAFIKVTKKINGGTNGLPQRRQYWARAKTALGVA